ncbi:MAG: helicase HerA-like domain-containing protein, partial [Thermodesulfobacteriota bacterium]
MNEPILAAKGEHELLILPEMANRHGLISGATGTGKTVTLQVLAENFSMVGVPVFMADVKGDLAGLSRPGSENPKITERINRIGLSNFMFGECPVTFWDVFGVQGHPVRTTISEMGPLLLSRLLNLNDTQTGVLTLVFEIADDGGLLLLDLKDLRSMLRYVGDNSSSYT